MVSKPQLNFISEQDYLAGQLISKVKHEYINGDIYAMAGASANRRLSSSIRVMIRTTANYSLSLLQRCQKPRAEPTRL